MIDLVRFATDEPAAQAGMTPPQHRLTDSLIEALREVYDPEIPVNIYDLGLIYRLHVNSANVVEVDMTLTAPNCPVAEAMPEMVREAIFGVDGVIDCQVNLVWDPPWDPSMMSEDARLALDM